MYFLISYDIVDRKDLTVSQKLTAIFLAREYDEKGLNAKISSDDIAKALNLSLNEVKINLEILANKGIINNAASNKLENKAQPKIENNEEIVANDKADTDVFSPLLDNVEKFETSNITSIITKTIGFPVSTKNANLLYSAAKQDLDLIKQASIFCKDSDDILDDIFIWLQHHFLNSNTTKIVKEEPTTSKTTNVNHNNIMANRARTPNIPKPKADDKLKTAFDILEKIDNKNNDIKSKNKSLIASSSFRRANSIYKQNKTILKNDKEL